MKNRNERALEAAQNVKDMIDNLEAIKGQQMARYAEVVVTTTSLMRLLMSAARPEAEDAVNAAAELALPDILERIGLLAGFTDEQIEECASASRRMLESAYSHMMKKPH